jgi:hypothetical protein
MASVASAAIAARLGADHASGSNEGSRSSSRRVSPCVMMIPLLEVDGVVSARRAVEQNDAERSRPVYSFDAR